MVNADELDRGKIEQCIINEESRLAFVEKSLEKTQRELTRAQEEFYEKESRLNKSIIRMKKSISSGKDFIDRCREKLKTLSTIIFLFLCLSLYSCDSKYERHDETLIGVVDEIQDNRYANSKYKIKVKSEEFNNQTFSLYTDELYNIGDTLYVYVTI